jgi:hypothetical protein
MQGVDETQTLVMKAPFIGGLVSVDAASFLIVGAVTAHDHPPPFYQLVDMSSIMPHWIAGLADTKRLARQLDHGKLAGHGPLRPLPPLRWRYHFFVSASATTSVLRRSSTHIFLKRRFSPAGPFMRALSYASMPPNLERYLQNVAFLMPYSRHSFGTEPQSSAGLRMAMIWLLVKQSVVM